MAEGRWGLSAVSPALRRPPTPCLHQAYLRPLVPHGPLLCIQTLGQMLAHVGRGSQSSPQLVGLTGQGAAQDVTGGPGPFLLCHLPPQQGDLLLTLMPWLAYQLLGLPLLLF